MRTVLIAPDKFKGSLAAPEVATALATGLRRVRPRVDVRLAPVADGGDGTVRAVLASDVPGPAWRSVAVRVTGPCGAPVPAEFALSGEVAVVELATASGLALLGPELAPLRADSTGTGELIRAALDHGARTIVLGVGGSASTDGGAGMVTALGARVCDEHGQPVPAGGGALREVSTVDLTGLDRRLADTTIVLASDVDNPLLGPRGAARIYAPQKGATAEQVDELEAALSRWSAAVTRAVGVDHAEAAGAGAAGGVGFGALAVLGARARSGAETVFELVGLDEQLATAELVITGEGALDEQTLHGKAPMAVSGRARDRGVPVIAVAGRCALSEQHRRAAGFAEVHALTDREPDVDRCLDSAAKLLTDIGADIAREWLPG